MSELSEMAIRESSHVIFHGHTAWDYRCACNGEGELGKEWNDKPHRIVYDLLRVIETIPAKDATIAELREENARLREKLADIAELLDEPHCSCDLALARKITESYRAEQSTLQARGEGKDGI